MTAHLVCVCVDILTLRLCMSKVYSKGRVKKETAPPGPFLIFNFIFFPWRQQCIDRPHPLSQLPVLLYVPCTRYIWTVINCNCVTQNHLQIVSLSLITLTYLTGKPKRSVYRGVWWDILYSKMRRNSYLTNFLGSFGFVFANLRSSYDATLDHSQSCWTFIGFQSPMLLRQQQEDDRILIFAGAASKTRVIGDRGWDHLIESFPQMLMFTDGHGLIFCWDPLLRRWATEDCRALKSSGSGTTVS